MQPRARGSQRLRLAASSRRWRGRERAAGRKRRRSSRYVDQQRHVPSASPAATSRAPRDRRARPIRPRVRAGARPERHLRKNRARRCSRASTDITRDLERHLSRRPHRTSPIGYGAARISHGAAGQGALRSAPGPLFASPKTACGREVRPRRFSTWVATTSRGGHHYAAWLRERATGRRLGITRACSPARAAAKPAPRR